MTRHRLYKSEPKEVRETLNRAIAMAETARDLQCDLLQVLRNIDQKKFYLRYGYRSLTGFCRQALQLPRLQAQSLVTEVRRNPGPGRPVDQDSTCAAFFETPVSEQSENQNQTKEMGRFADSNSLLWPF